MPLLADSFDRMTSHLQANGINLEEPVLHAGASLTMDPHSETFPGNSEANHRATREYRAPYVVPEIKA
jgi:hypothetical protein